MSKLEQDIAALVERARVKACLGDSDELRDAFYEMDAAYQAERLLREADALHERAGWTEKVERKYVLQERDELRAQAAALVEDV